MNDSAEILLVTIPIISHFSQLHGQNMTTFGKNSEENRQNLKIPRNIQKTPWSQRDIPPLKIGAYSLQKLCPEQDSTTQVPQLF